MGLAFGTYKGTTTKDRKPKKWHRYFIEQLLGKELNPSVEIHHVDYNRGNNTNSNLVVCPSRSYHQLLHKRQEILDAGFNPNTHAKCTDCRSHLELSSFSKNKTRVSGYNNICKFCCSKRSKERYEALKLSH